MAIRNLYADFGARVRRRRSELGLTQDALAKQVDLSRASIANVEAGRQAVLLHQVIDLARALDTDAQSLLPEDDRRIKLAVENLPRHLPREVKEFIGALSQPALGKGE